jgi:CarboxypepD_reg-like domain/TonB-dependent Receptor Plug Domain
MAVSAQGTVAVRVVTDSGARPITDAYVGIPMLHHSAITDSTGRATLERVPEGTHRVVSRVIGFRPDSMVIEVADGVTREITLRLRTHTPVLQEIRVSAAARAIPPKMAGFYQRQERGIGRFLDREALAKNEHRRTSDILNSVPGVYVRYGHTSKAWASSGRAINAGGCPTCGTNPSLAALDPADRIAGAGPACYMDVYIDGAIVYNSSARYASLYDLNSIGPGSIEAIEIYAAGSQLPAEFHRTGSACGAVLIWLRESLAKR